MEEMNTGNTVEVKKPSRIRRFLEREHTPFEKGMMIAAGFVTGLAAGILLSPRKGGIEISIGSHNGTNTYR